MRKKKFIDFCHIFVQAGNGGDGHIGFRREKYVPKGGPDGGDGGRGGSIIAQGSKDMHSLLEYTFRRIFKAKHGKPGGRTQKTGAGADDIIIKVPLGTVFRDKLTQRTIGEITQQDQSIVLQEGGRGGLGNQHFATSTNQTPRKATPGDVREGFWLQVELRLLADLGLIGFPNAGKSTLLSKLTDAKPKTGDYPFTTISPNIGISQKDDHRILIGDMPGLIKDAYQGVGLGLKFLRHIQRTKALLFVLNGDPQFEHTPSVQLEILKNELASFDQFLIDKPCLVAINKVDLLKGIDTETLSQDFEETDASHLFFISSQTGYQLEKLRDALHELL